MSDLSKSPPEKKMKAVADGKIIIGNLEIDCAILEDGSQVIRRASILKLIGRSSGGGRPPKAIQELKSKGMHVPTFLSAANLIPFMPNDLSKRSTPLEFVPLRGGKALGYKANLIPDICDIYVDAMVRGDVLTKDQIPIAKTLFIISKGLQRVGIAGLVNEACGISSNKKDFLQQILSEYINASLLKWTKKFPDHFFTSYKRMYGINKEDRIQSHVGIFINKFIYGELAPGVLEELKRLNPKNEEGRRKNAHHQYLTPSKGVLELDKQLIRVSSVMSMSEDRKDFEDKYRNLKELEQNA